MIKLLRYMKGYGKECILGPLLKLAEATLELLVPYVILAIINNGIAGKDKSYIVYATLILVGMGFLGLLFSVAAQFFSAKAAVGFSSRVREALFRHVQSLSYKEIDGLGRSTLITRLTSDMNQVQTGVNLALRLFLRSPFIVFGAMIMAFTIDKEAALTFVVVIPILAIVVFGIMLAGIPLYKKVQSRLDAILFKTRENLTGVRMLRALCKEEEEAEDFDEKNDLLCRSQKFVGRISSIMNPLTYVIINLAIAFLMYKGAVKVEYGVLTQGAVLALYNYMSQILVELIKLANLTITITKGVACANRVEAVLETKPSLEAKPEVRSERDDLAVEFDGVSFRYGKGGENALNDISFAVRHGQTVGIIGGTGSGKSTLVNLLCRFYEAGEGTVFVDGRNVDSYPTDELLAKIGIVPQKATLFRGTVRSNMAFGKDNVTDTEIWEALDDAQAKEFVEKKEGGLDAPVEQFGRNLSGGQRQRLTVARALVRKPSILILDDSSSALDYATDLALRRAIKALDYDPTVFIVSQRASTLRGADLIVVLDEGNAVGIGTHDELYETCDVYREICDSQTKRG
ncbi:MAG: ABC transporter ATP-binding protein [Clostridia bacterium]|nr:ABC transporter ATP-binding protein [Clostridia bacterium]